MGSKRAYDEAIGSGYYRRRSGLVGKYDNVRTFWEDEVMRIFIRPYIKKLEEEKGKIRVLDMGCGYGDGYELLRGLSDNIKYHGFDMNESFIKEARNIYNDEKDVSFEVADFNSDPPLGDIDGGYDLYFTSYGALSHNSDEQNEQLLRNIAYHSDSCLIVCDWLGAYSYEWQDLWGDEWLDYRISYIPGGGEESFPLRLMTRDNISKIVEKASSKIKVEEIFDRSIFQGRHMDTSKYNEHCKPIRSAVNSLFEPNRRTTFEDLLIDYHPKAGHSSLNSFFEDFSMHWNSLVGYMMYLFGKGYEVEAELPEMERLKRMVESDMWIKDSNHRENVIEPQFGYALRNLEMRRQRGIGTAHGLVSILSI